MNQALQSKMKILYTFPKLLFILPSFSLKKLLMEQSNALR